MVCVQKVQITSLVLSLAGARVLLPRKHTLLTGLLARGCSPQLGCSIGEDLMSECPPNLAAGFPQKEYHTSFLEQSSVTPQPHQGRAPGASASTHPQAKHRLTGLPGTPRPARQTHTGIQTHPKVKLKVTTKRSGSEKPK